MVKLLLKYNAEINIRDHNGVTALYWAVWFTHPKIAELLIEKGTDVNIPRIEHGETALHAATKDGENSRRPPRLNPHSGQ